MSAFRIKSTSGFIASLALCGLASAIPGASAFAYTPKWLACDGQLVVSTTSDGKTQSSTQPAHDVYVYDDDNRHLYWHSDKLNTDSIEPVTVYNDHEIKWSGHGSNIFGSEWDGRIDRSSLALKLNYREKDSTRTWTEQCKPTQPINEKQTAGR